MRSNITCCEQVSGKHGLADPGIHMIDVGSKGPNSPNHRVLHSWGSKLNKISRSIQNVFKFEPQLRFL